VFLRAVSESCRQMPNLFEPQVGNRVLGCDGQVGMNRLVELAPHLNGSNSEQVAALPLSSRVAVDPWNDNNELVKPALMRPVSSREKMSFEMMPVMLSPKPREDSQPPDNLAWLTADRSTLPAWPAWK